MAQPAARPPAPLHNISDSTVATYDPNKGTTTPNPGDVSPSTRNPSKDPDNQALVSARKAYQNRLGKLSPDKQRNPQIRQDLKTQVENDFSLAAGDLGGAPTAPPPAANR